MFLFISWFRIKRVWSYFLDQGKTKTVKGLTPFDPGQPLDKGEEEDTGLDMVPLI